MKHVQSADCAYDSAYRNLHNGYKESISRPDKVASTYLKFSLNNSLLGQGSRIFFFSSKFLSTFHFVVRFFFVEKHLSSILKNNMLGSQVISSVTLIM